MKWVTTAVPLERGLYHWKLRPIEGSRESDSSRHLHGASGPPKELEKQDTGDDPTANAADSLGQGPGISSFEGSPGDPSVQPRWRTTEPQTSRLTWCPAAPVPRSPGVHLSLCLGQTPRSLMWAAAERLKVTEPPINVPVGCSLWE